MTSVQIIANPAVTVGRIFSDTFAGIAPGSVPGFIAAQIVGDLLTPNTTDPAGHLPAGSFHPRTSSPSTPPSCSS